MIVYLLRRAGWALAVIATVLTVTFFVNSVLPTDPARMVAGPQARPADVARIRVQLGLDKPVLERYGAFVGRLIHLGPRDVDPTVDTAHATCATFAWLHVDLGRSYQMRRPVVAVIGERLPRTVGLALGAIAIQIFLGVASGAIAASRRGTSLDGGVVGLSLLGISAPTFILGTVLQFFLAHRLHLLPLDGFGNTPIEHVVCGVLPALTLGIFGAAYTTRIVRDELIGALGQDYVRTARAKGASRVGVLFRHALRNALLPLVTLIGLDLGALVGGAIVTESLFRWPGLGALSVNAMFDRDGPIIVGTVLVTSAAVVAANFAVDVIYALLDPRVR